MSVSFKQFTPDAVVRIEISQFLKFFFDKLESSLLPYAVMRNYEGLPNKKPGNDIDIMVRRRDLNKHRRLLDEVAEYTGWKLIQASERVPIYVYKLAKLNGEGSFPPIIHLDYFPGESWHGAQFLSGEELLERREPYESIHILDTMGRVLTLVLHHLLYTGNLGKDKYKEDIRVVLTSQARELRMQLKRIVGKGLSIDLMNILDQYLREKCTTELRVFRSSLRRAVVARTICDAPLRSLFLWGKLTSQEFRRFFWPKGLMIFIWAESGSGRVDSVLSNLLPWLWLIDRRNHAFIGDNFRELRVHQEPQYRKYVQTQYGFDDLGIQEAPRKKLLWRLRLNWSRGRIIVLEDNGDLANANSFRRSAMYFVLARDPDCNVVKRKLREIEAEGVECIVLQDDVMVEAAIANYIAKYLAE